MQTTLAEMAVPNALVMSAKENVACSYRVYGAESPVTGLFYLGYEAALQLRRKRIAESIFGENASSFLINIMSCAA